MDSDSLWCVLGNDHALFAWGDLPLSKFRCFLYLWRLSLGEVFVFQGHPGWMAARCARTGSEGTPERPTGSLLEWSHVWERGLRAVSGPSEAGRAGPQLVLSRKTQWLAWVGVGAGPVGG